MCSWDRLRWRLSFRPPCRSLGQSSRGKVRGARRAKGSKGRVRESSEEGERQGQGERDKQGRDKGRGKRSRAVRERGGAAEGTGGPCYSAAASPNLPPCFTNAMNTGAILCSSVGGPFGICPDLFLEH